MLMTSALKRFPASSKEVRVRVEDFLSLGGVDVGKVAGNQIHAQSLGA